MHVQPLIDRLGFLHRREGRYDLALVELVRCLELREATFRDHPTIASYKHGVAWTRYNLGIVRQKTGRLAEARLDLERARELYGDMLLERGNAKEALAAYQKAEIEKWWPIIRDAGIKAQ